jgi:hypothetical protein
MMHACRDRFWPKISCWKRKCETVHGRDTTVSSFLSKVLGEVFTSFHTVAIKRHLSRLFSVWVSLEFAFQTTVWLMLSFPNTCVIIAMISVAVFRRFAQNLGHIHRVKSHQARYTTPNKCVKNPHVQPLLEIVYADSQDVLVPSSSVGSRCCNCCTDRSTNPGYYG